MGLGVRVPPEAQIMITCKNCEEETDNPRFCSNSCPATYNNSRRKRVRNTKNCKNENCNNEFFGQNSYCRECIDKRIHLDARRVYNLEDAETDKTRKKILVKERGARCEECRRKTWMGRDITLELHHIDGDSSNNNPDNLMIICPNCHSQTTTYKAKNLGNGRPNRY